MKRGELVVVAMRGDYGKVRPCLVVQSDRYQDDFDSIIVYPLSTSVEATHLLRIQVEPNAANGLRSASVIMTDKTVAVLRSRIRERIGFVGRSILADVDRALALLLEITREAR
jgi:mRNA interferase MazF